jgi:ABC-type Mn2+/Zn2+ transport system permease subunit
VDLVAILFGDVLGTSWGDLVVQGVAAVIAVGGVVLFYRPLLVLSFNEQKAATLGLRPRLAHLLMMGLITVAVVASFQTVGALLVFGLLIAPPATAVLVARRVPTVMVTASVLGTVEVAAGLLISFHFDTAAGATMSGLAVAVFFVVRRGSGSGLPGRGGGQTPPRRYWVTMNAPPGGPAGSARRPSLGGSPCR